MVATSCVIRSDTWNIFLLSDHQYRKKCGTGSQAITYYKHETGLREVNFKASVYCKSTLIHELVHCHLSYRSFRGKPYGQIEEEVCDEFGARGARLLNTANRIDRLFRAALRG